MPYGMATITIEMAIAPWLRDAGASWLVDRHVHRFSTHGEIGTSAKRG